MFAPIPTIFSVLFLATTLPNGIKLIELPENGDSVEIIAGYDEPGLAGLPSTPAARSLIFDVYAAGGDIQFVNQRDRTALRLTIPRWAFPMLTDRQLSGLFKDIPEGIEAGDHSMPSSDFRTRVEQEIRNALLETDLQQRRYATDDAFVAISAPISETLRDALAAISRRASGNRAQEQIRLPAERTLRFKSDLPTGAVIFAAPVPTVYYREWYLVLLLDRVIHRTVPIPLETVLVLSAHPYYYRIELSLLPGQFPEPAEENLLQELQRLQLTPVDARQLSAAKQEALAYLDGKEIREWFVSHGIPERLEEGMQWIQSMTADDLRSAARDLLLMNRVIATWSPTPKQTTVKVEALNDGNGGPPSPSGSGRRDTQQAVAPGEGSRLELPSFPPHKDAAQNVAVAERLGSGVSLVAGNINGVFVSSGNLTKYAHAPDDDTVKSFEKYRADRILVFTLPDEMDHARQLWSSFKGSNAREGGVPKGPISSGDLPAVFVLKTILDLKVIEAGWWHDVELRINASEGSALQIRADAEKLQRILAWIKEIAAQAPPDKDFAWMREVAIHRFDTIRSDLQALTWERDPQGTIQEIETIVPKVVQDVAQIYF